MIAASALALGAWLLVALAGLAIGATSIGGVLVVPALHRWMGLSISDALAVSSQAFLLTGLWALWRLPRMGLDLMRREGPWLWAGLCGAALGAWLTGVVPAHWIRAWVGALALVSGAYGLWRARGAAHPPAAAWPQVPAQVLVGGLVGLGSALSGTGGPVMLLPLLMLRHCDLLRSVQLGLVMQVPIALAATATHGLAGRLDLRTGLVVAVVLMVSAEAGRRLSRHWSPRVLQAVTALLLLGTALWMFSIGSNHAAPPDTPGAPGAR